MANVKTHIQVASGLPAAGMMWAGEVRYPLAPACGVPVRRRFMPATLLMQPAAKVQ